MTSNSPNDSAPKLTVGRILLWGATLPLASVLALLAIGGVGGFWTLGSSVALAVMCAIGDLVLRRRGTRRDRRGGGGRSLQADPVEGVIDDR